MGLKVEEDGKFQLEEKPMEDVANVCFVCQGRGHWARECTSLPSMYLKEDAPRCYKCGGLGHFARFCPNTEKQVLRRRQRFSIAMENTTEWSTYIYPVPPIQDPVVFIRPEYPPSVFSEASSTKDEVRSDSSPVEYILEDVDGFVNESISVTTIMIDTSIEAAK